MSDNKEKDNGQSISFIKNWTDDEVHEVEVCVEYPFMAVDWEEKQIESQKKRKVVNITESDSKKKKI
ncbi:hypothetical protein DAMA08_024740 [Martiniozyma asiatica (nom. inval.)]|nr:hypothetical protein DAMA08_024740 [Martiniozyma asiatica]